MLIIQNKNNKLMMIDDSKTFFINHFPHMEKLPQNTLLNVTLKDSKAFPLNAEQILDLKGFIQPTFKIKELIVKELEIKFGSLPHLFPDLLDQSQSQIPLRNFILDGTLFMGKNILDIYIKFFTSHFIDKKVIDILFYPEDVSSWLEASNEELKSAKSICFYDQELNYKRYIPTKNIHSLNVLKKAIHQFPKEKVTSIFGNQDNLSKVTFKTIQFNNKNSLVVVVSNENI